MLYIMCMLCSMASSYAAGMHTPCQSACGASHHLVLVIGALFQCSSRAPWDSCVLYLPLHGNRCSHAKLKATMQPES